MVEKLRLVAVAHCILNQATRWWNEGKLEPPAKGPLSEVVQKLTELGIGIYQLPCPELLFLGNPRRAMNKDEYEALAGYRAHTRRLASKAASELEELLSKSEAPRLDLIGLIGLARSPSCACSEALFERAINRREATGIFFEELLLELRRRGLSPRLIEVDVKEIKRSLLDLDKLRE